MCSSRVRFVAVGCAVAFAVLFAVSSARAEDEVHVRDFGFRPLEIYRFKHATSQLTVEDVNNDGLDDVVFANNRESRLEVLVRKKEPDARNGELPAIEDTFDDRGMIIDQALSGVRLVDLNGDKLLDIVTFGMAIGLQKRLQQKDGAFGRPERIYVERVKSVTGLEIEDLNGDERPDIVVSRRDGLEILWNDKDTPFRRKQTLALSEDSCTGIEIADINDDGNQDLLVYFKSTTIPVKARLGNGKGGFGLEHPLELPPQRYSRLVSRETKGTPQLGCVLQNGLGVRLYKFLQDDQEELLKNQEVVPRMVALAGRDQKAASPWVAADFDKDGYDDVLVGAPALSQLHLYRGTQDGLTADPEKIDSLAAVNEVCRLSDGNVLVVSAREKSAAIHNMSRRSEFPEIIKLPGEVVAGTALRKSGRMFFVCKDEEGKLKLIERPVGKGESREYELDLANDPKSLMGLDLGSDGVAIMFFVSYASPVMFRLKDGELNPVEVADFRALSYELKPSQVTYGSRKDDKSLLVSYQKTARMYEWKDGEFKVTRQFNPGNDNARVETACLYTGRAEGDGIMIYDGEARDVVWYSAKDLEREPVKVHLEAAPGQIAGLVNLRNKKRDVLLLVGAKDLAVVSAGKGRITLDPGPEYMSPSDKPSIIMMNDVALGEPPRPMFAVVDMRNRSVELISRKGERGLQKELVFEVFLDAGFSSGRGQYGAEPHGVESGDINGDGIGDLVILVHDKLLIYLGE